MPNCFNRSGIAGTQINPRPNRAMKLIDAGVAHSPAMIKSPSFSRSSSSTTIAMAPLAQVRDDRFN